MTTDIFCFYLQNRLNQIVKQEVNGTVILPPLVFPGFLVRAPVNRRLKQISGKLGSPIQIRKIRNKILKNDFSLVQFYYLSVSKAYNNYLLIKLMLNE